MSVFQSLSVVALRQLVGGVCKVVGISGAADKVVEVLTTRFTDQSQRLTKALQTANERAWKSLEVALGGESLWERIKGKLANAEDQAFREQVRAFLDASPLKNVKSEHLPKLQKALEELRTARSRGLLTGNSLSPAELAQQAGGFARFNDPQAVINEEWNFVNGIARELQPSYPFLCQVLMAQEKPVPRPSILAVAVRYYFRREVEQDQQLFNGLAITKLEALQEGQEKGFALLTLALTQQGARLEGLLGNVLVTVVETNERTKETNERTKGIDEAVRRLPEVFQTLLERFQLQSREVRRSDSLSIRSDGERRIVQQAIDQYRALPEEKRQENPGLLTSVGKLEMATGNLEAAQRDFGAVAVLTADPKKRAEAYHNAYQAALERQQWSEALSALQQAIALDPARFAPFPLDKYIPKRILGAGGFGVVFLCQPRYLKKPVVIKSLLPSELTRDIGDVFGEAQALEEIDHPAIIRLKDCGYADIAETRPYLMMDYFEGPNLDSFISSNGPLSPEDLLAVAVPVAEALQVAHARGIFHRDVKPANILVRREGERWQVKLIDFGLAMRPGTLAGMESTQGSQAKTTTGKSIAGTLHYAAPEQMGQLPGVVVGPYSDVYGFGKSCYFAMLGTPEPDDAEKDRLPDCWRRLLSRCTGRKLDYRFLDFAAVLTGLSQVRQVVSVPDIRVDVAECEQRRLTPEGSNPYLEQFAPARLADWRSAAEHGSAGGQWLLGRCLQEGIGVQQDLAAAPGWFRKAADQGFAPAQNNLGRMYADGSGVAQDKADALRWVRLAAEQGDACGQFALGCYYEDACGLPENEAEAVRWYRLAAEQGEVHGQYHLGRMYAHGRGVAKDETEAARWYRLAAEQGYAPAQCDLASSYAYGCGVATDEAEAVRWYRLAAGQGYAFGQFSLGCFYEDGRGVAKDEQEALRWYRLAAEQGYAFGQVALGKKYADGSGVAKDEAEAVRLYRLAAEQEFASAQYNLGCMYLEGNGVPQDKAEAEKWFRLAAEQEYTEAKKKLKKLTAQNSSEKKDKSAKEPDDEQARPDRQGLRKTFWEGLLNRPKAKTSRHANISPGEAGWIGAGSGVRGLSLNFVVGQDESRVELYIDRGADQTDTNKGIFDWLEGQKKEIEGAFGGKLSWQRLGKKRACRIAHLIAVGGYRSDEAKWPEIQDAMIEAMIRFEVSVHAETDRIIL